MKRTSFHVQNIIPIFLGCMWLQRATLLGIIEFLQLLAKHQTSSQKDARASETELPQTGGL